MSNQRYTPEFKDEAARQIVDRGYSVADVSERLGVSAHSLYKWVKAIKPDKTEEQAANQGNFDLPPYKELASGTVAAGAYEPGQYRALPGH